MMGGRSLTSGKEKAWVKHKNYTDIQTSDGIVRFTKEVKVCIQELDTYLCVLHRQIRSSRRVHQAKSYSIMRYNSNRARLRKGKPSARKRSVGDHVFFFNCWNPFSEGMIDDNVALELNQKLEVTLLRKQRLLGLQPMRKGKPLRWVTTARVIGTRRANDSKPKEYITMCSCISRRIRIVTCARWPRSHSPDANTDSWDASMESHLQPHSKTLVTAGTKSWISSTSFLRIFLPPFQNRGRVYTDNSSKFINTCQDQQWTHDTNTLHQSETKGIAEGAVRRVKDGTAMAMVQSDLPEDMWHRAMECSCYLRDVRDKVADDRTAYENKYLVYHLADLWFRSD